MITTSNYFDEVNKIGLSRLPQTLQKGHDLVVFATSNGTSWENYSSKESIRKVIDLYLTKLNEFAKTIQPDTPQVKPAIELQRKDAKQQTLPTKKAKLTDTKSASVKHVEHIREEVKFIKRYVGLHNKIKTPNAILAFIKALQKSIVQKLVRKSSPLAGEINMIQNKLVQAYNRMKGEESFAINEKDLNRLAAIAGGEQVYRSIAVIKRFIGLQGKDDKKKIGDFTKSVEKMLADKKFTEADPYLDKVNAILKMLKNRTASKIVASKAELNGLEGIVRACSSVETNISNDRTSKLTNNTSHQNSTTLNGVLTAEQMANRKLDLLSFTSFWHSLFGNPATNFTLMIHGEPHNGKTIFLLKLAQYLADKFGEVLYVSSEEFASPTMTKKVNEFLRPLPVRLHFAENLTDPDLSKYQFIILDSVNDLGLSISKYKEIRKAHADKAFIFILQHTKAGDFRGGKDWEHIAEIVGEVHKGKIALSKNRYAPKSELDFFEQLGIEWQELTNQSTLKPYPISINQS